jgi:hypothetical protein
MLRGFPQPPGTHECVGSGHLAARYVLTRHRQQRALHVRRIGGSLREVDRLAPVFTPLAMRHDTGAMCVYHGDTVLFE